MILEAAALALALIHFGVPLAYYLYLRKMWPPKPWVIRRDPGYAPKVAVVVSTYNEAALIEKKLDKDWVNVVAVNIAVKTAYLD